ncbi:type IV pilus modification PilV family protein [Cohnella sp. JJ-181]|uniref:type IV pilus modification PilV family protein n=1 Tax=Cohnella rhizoplanae TaxID=2974897 RepID=UPI0022FF864F|nr:prepilin-type N-terminal cleavage/methylation domain-containing protein [Cohnella sp. JJ-181]CAI6040843.1 hypothetical protein COHCIP112018_01081 [Cohnella sp. JJ-181]
MRTWLRKPRRGWRGGEDGFSLLEVLAAIVILSVVSLAMTAFFIQAMTYAKGNQNKTVAVNLARYGLFFMEKVNYQTYKTYFASQPTLSPEGCEKLNIVTCGADGAKAELFNKTPNMWEALNPTVNGRQYRIAVEFQDDFWETNKDKANLADYLLPIKVSAWDISRGPDDARGSAEVEGYITDEKIR